jgi:hypothetical protein
MIKNVVKQPAALYNNRCPVATMNELVARATN